MYKVKTLLYGFVGAVIVLAIAQALFLFFLAKQLHDINELERNVTHVLVEQIAETKYNTVQIQQFLTDSAATLNPDSEAEAAKSLKAAHANLTKISSLSPDLAGQSQALQQALTQLFDTGIKMVTAYGDSREAGNQIMQAADGFDAQIVSAQQLVDQLDASVKSRQTKMKADVDDRTEAIASGSILVGIVLALLTLIGGMAVNRSVMKTLGGEPYEGKLAASALEHGDLTYMIQVKAGDSDSLMASLSRIRGRWTDVISGLRGQAAMLSIGAGQLTEQAHQLAHFSAEQSGNANRIAANVEELSVTMGQMAAQATGAFGQVAATGEAAMRTTRVLQDVTHEIVSVEQSVGLSAERIGKLHLQMAEIDSIVTTIREVANQTNLLALNAAIEAARAGEAGRGFAVVADEVRQLADRTSASAKSIGDMIAGVGQMTNEIVQVIEQSVERVSSGVGLIETAQNEMSQVLASSIDASKDMAQIHDALDEISKNTDDIARAVEQVAHSSGENADAAKVLSATSVSINEVAESLGDDTAYFKMATPGDDMELF